MRLTDNKYITESVADLFVADKLTMEKLATTQTVHLTKYKGVGSVTAKRIIDEAKRLVNLAKMEEAAKFEPPVMPEQDADLPPMSARVRRIMEQNQ